MTHVGHDNGSEFQGHFRTTCEKLGIPQYHSWVKSPKDNATNERFNRTLREELLEAEKAYDDLDIFNCWLTTWLVEYHAHRSHQTFGYDTDVFYPAARKSDTKVLILYT